MKSRPLLRLFLVLLLIVVELGIALPVLPALALALGGNAVDIGLLYAIQSFGQFATSPLWGELSDRLGRRRVIAFTILLVAVAELGTAFAPTLAMLYVTRLVVGLCAGGIAAASALVTDVTSAEERSRGMAVVGISFGLGFTIGPGLGAGIGFLAADGPGPLGSGLPFLFAAGLGLVNAVLAMVLLTEPPIDEERRQRNRRERPTWSEVRILLRDRAAHAMLTLNFMYTVAASVMESTFFVFMYDRYAYDERQVGMIFAGLGLLMAFTQGSVGRVSKSVGERAMTVGGGVLVALGMVIAPAFWAVAPLLACLGVATIGRAYIHPGILSLTSKTPPAVEDPGRVMGALQSASSLGRIVGPAVGGAVFAWIAPEAPFVAASILMAIAIVVWALRDGKRG